MFAIAVNETTQTVLLSNSTVKQGSTTDSNTRRTDSVTRWRSWTQHNNHQRDLGLCGDVIGITCSMSEWRRRTFVWIELFDNWFGHHWHWSDEDGFFLLFCWEFNEKQRFDARNASIRRPIEWTFLNIKSGWWLWPPKGTKTDISMMFCEILTSHVFFHTISSVLHSFIHENTVHHFHMKLFSSCLFVRLDGVYSHFLHQNVVSRWIPNRTTRRNSIRHVNASDAQTSYQTTQFKQTFFSVIQTWNKWSRSHHHRDSTSVDRCCAGFTIAISWQNPFYVCLSLSLSLALPVLLESSTVCVVSLTAIANMSKTIR